MCWTRALITGWILLLVQLLCLEAVPISIDKTKVNQPEKTPEEPPASVVRKLKTFDELLLVISKHTFCPVNSLPVLLNRHLALITESTVTLKKIL